ncbi:hypothetical protein I4U23_025425 [Adineta vaga]|nr:hypothetical protein I4U23_025425 [Adineta vaga]
MSSGKKQQKKRKRHSSSSPPPLIKSHIARRLEKIRHGRTNLWDDDDDEEEEENNVVDEQPKTKHNRKSYIMRSDSDEERPSKSSQRRLRSSKSRKKTSRHHRESATCLICSILSQLSTYNCCSTHLSLLKNPPPQQTTHSRRLPERVRFVPMTDHLVQRYFDPQSRRRTSTSPITQPSTRKSLNKSTMTPNSSDVRRSMKTTSKSVTKSSQADIRPLASTIVIEPAQSNSSDIANTTVTSSSSPPPPAIHDVANGDPMEQSRIQTITIDDTEQDISLVHSTHDRKQIDLWTEISEETDAALERVLDQIESFSNSPLEFTPATARRTHTETMAARLPKIPLKQGRFRNGRPINNHPTTNGANEYRPSVNVQTSPPSSSVVTTRDVSSPPLQTTSSVRNGSTGQILNRSENRTDHHDIFTQDENYQDTNNSITTQTNEALASMSNENSDLEIEINRSNGNISHTSTIVKGKGTPSRLSIRFNPDGSQVKISKPPLPIDNRRSSSISSLRRTSTDVTPIQSNTKQM